tara:strand:+ start:2621 stop:3067 length:447 start_codon:yes stop_codon:yes gene_type:complete
MGFFKKIDKVLSSSKDFNLMERTEVDIEIEENINKVGIDKYATSDYADVYLRTNELGGFLILETITVSATNLKSKKGTKLTFQGNNESLTFDSDENKIESDFSEAVNKSITKIDYNITEDQVKKIEDKIFDTLSFEINQKKIELSILK